MVERGAAGGGIGRTHENYIKFKCPFLSVRFIDTEQANLFTCNLQLLSYIMMGVGVIVSEMVGLQGPRHLLSDSSEVHDF